MVLIVVGLLTPVVVGVLITTGALATSWPLLPIALLAVVAAERTRNIALRRAAAIAFLMLPLALVGGKVWGGAIAAVACAAVLCLGGLIVQRLHGRIS